MNTEIRHILELTFVRGISENRWLRGWKNDINRLIILEALMASSSRDGFRKGPSTSSIRTSNCHRACSFVDEICNEVGIKHVDNATRGRSHLRFIQRR